MDAHVSQQSLFVLSRLQCSPQARLQLGCISLNIKLITFYLDAHPVHAVEDLLDGFIIPWLTQLKRRAWQVHQSEWHICFHLLTSYLLITTNVFESVHGIMNPSIPSRLTYVEIDGTALLLRMASSSSGFVFHQRKLLCVLVIVHLKNIFFTFVDSCDINILPRISRTIHKYWLDIEYWWWQNVEDGYGVGLNINCLIKAGVSNWFCIRGQFIKSEREAWWCCSTLQLFKFYSEDWGGRLIEIAALKYSMDYGMPWLEVQ